MSARDMTVKIATMQRDETLLLEPWLRYHGYLFGFENLYVHDNGSEDPGVLDVLARFAKAGVTVVYGPRDSRDFDAKGTLLAEVIRKWDDGTDYDFAFPIDCDEFIALRERGAVTCQRNAIQEYLGAIRDLPRNFKVDTNLFNVPALPGWYWPQEGKKTFFASRTLNHLDHGFHYGSVRSDGNEMNTSITYFHMHFKPWTEFVRSARAKLIPYVDVDDLEALRTYGGPNGHVQQQLLEGRDAYEARFKGCFRIHLPGPGLLLRLLGETSALFDEGVESLAFPDHAVTSSSHLFPLTGEFQVFDGLKYLLRWGDVAQSKADPLLHYLRHGFYEGRAVS